MFPKITLAQQGMTTTRLGFGTSRLHHVPPSTRADLIAAALDCGIGHFDTAPVYGDGIGERSLGLGLRGRRDRVTLATKAGLAPNPIADMAPALAPVVLAAKALRRNFRASIRPRAAITPRDVRLSLEHSLRRLQTDWIDLFLLHEPTKSVLPEADAVIETMHALIKEGKVRYIGLAGAASSLSGLDPKLFAQNLIVQTQADAGPVHGAPADIVYGALSPGIQSFGFSPALTAEDANARLAVALKANVSRCVLVSTRNPSRLQALAHVATAVGSP